MSKTEFIERCSTARCTEIEGPNIIDMLKWYTSQVVCCSTRCVLRAPYTAALELHVDPEMTRSRHVFRKTFVLHGRSVHPTVREAYGVVVRTGEKLTPEETKRVRSIAREIQAATEMGVYVHYQVHPDKVIPLKVFCESI